MDDPLLAIVDSAMQRRLINNVIDLVDLEDELRIFRQDTWNWKRMDEQRIIIWPIYRQIFQKAMLIIRAR